MGRAWRSLRASCRSSKGSTAKTTAKHRKQEERQCAQHFSFITSSSAAAWSADAEMFHFALSIALPFCSLALGGRRWLVGALICKIFTALAASAGIFRKKQHRYREAVVGRLLYSCCREALYRRRASTTTT